MKSTLRNTKKKSQAMALLAPLVLAGCSSVPDAINPVEWYDATTELFTGDDDADENAGNENVAEGVSTAPVEVSDRQVANVHELPEGFIPPNTTGYDEPINRQGEVVNALPDEEAPVVAKVEPTPAPESVEAAPVETPAPVTAATVAAAPSVETVSPQTLDEIFAANVNQNRAVNPNVQMRWNLGDSYSQNYNTVVVSGSGVAQRAAPQGRQVAALSDRFSAQTAGQGYGSLLALQPSLVQAGQVQALEDYNPAAFAGTFQVATIQFENGSSGLSQADIDILREVVSVHRQQGGIVRVVGHASSRTRDMAPDDHVRVNQKMSVQRSNAVAQALLQLGMQGELLFVGGVADQQPLYREVMPIAEAANRRTEIFIDY